MLVVACEEKSLNPVGIAGGVNDFFFCFRSPGNYTLFSFQINLYRSVSIPPDTQRINGISIDLFAAKKREYVHNSPW